MYLLPVNKEYNCDSQKKRWLFLSREFLCQKSTWKSVPFLNMTGGRHRGSKGRLVCSVAKSYPTLCNPMDCRLLCPSLSPRAAQILVHQVGDAIQPSHPLSSASPPAFNLPQHQGLFQQVSSSHQVAKVLEFQFQHQSFQWTPRTDLL